MCLQKLYFFFLKTLKCDFCYEANKMFLFSFAHKVQFYDFQYFSIG